MFIEFFNDINVSKGAIELSYSQLDPSNLVYEFWETVSKEQVWLAYKKVRSNQGSAGIDQVSMDECDANRSKHLYKLWNRLASGCYFPPPVKEVEIPNKNGKTLNLGIPTISDRVAQMIVKDYLEPRFEKVFSRFSYGYRPGKNARQALSAVRKNCRQNDWVIDLDIKEFFDNINHQKLMLAIGFLQELGEVRQKF